MTVTLRTADGNGIDVDAAVARSSTLISNMLDDLGEIDGQTIPLGAIPEIQILDKAMCYAAARLLYPDPPGAMWNAWCNEFLASLSHEELLDIINAANYMEMKDLYETTCRAAAWQLVGKTADEIKLILKLEEES